MIVEAIVNVFVFLLNGLLSVLPDWDPPDLTGLLDDVEPLFGFLGWGNKYAPLAEMGALVGVMVLFYVGLYVFRFVVWIYEKLPFT